MNITGKHEVIFDEDLPETKLMDGVDPFQHITIASVCMQVFNTKFLQEDWRVKVRNDGKLTDWLPA